jgi:hypothetical protein
LAAKLMPALGTFAFHLWFTSRGGAWNALLDKFDKVTTLARERYTSADFRSHFLFRDQKRKSTSCSVSFASTRMKTEA